MNWNKLDRSGTDQTSIKGPVKIAYNKFVSKLTKQEDTTSSVLCQFTYKDTMVGPHKNERSGSGGSNPSIGHKPMWQSG